MGLKLLGVLQALITTGYDKLLRLWRQRDEEGYQCVDEREAHNCNIHHGVFSADGAVYATAAEDGTVRLWNVAALEQGKAAALIATLENGNVTLSGCVFEGLAGLAVASSDSRVRLWQLPSGVAQQEGLQEIAPTPKDTLRTSSEVFEEKQVAPPEVGSISEESPAAASSYSMADKVEADVQAWKKNQRDLRLKKKAEWERKQAAFDMKIGASGDSFLKTKSIGDSLPRPTAASIDDGESTSMTESSGVDVDDSRSGPVPFSAPGQKMLLCGGARRQCGCSIM